MRTGPICRNVQDAAKILDVIAGYDAQDEMTVSSIGRRPQQPYVSFATTRRLDGIRIGVIREYMARELFSKADDESIDIVERAIDDLRKIGATIVDPGVKGALFQGCISRYAPELLNASFTRQYPELFPVDSAGRPQSDQIATLLDMNADPARVPQTLSLRSLNTLGVQGEDKYMMDKYLRERHDANIKTNADLIDKAKFYEDPNFPDRKQGRQAAERATVLDTSARLQTRVALQTIFLQCMQEQRLDALVSPMSTVPPRKLTAPREPNANGRSAIGWSLLGQQGFPAITVPAGFTTEVWDRVHDSSGGTRLIGPVPANLPVGVDFIAGPFEETILFKIASAFEAATRHRHPPPDFGPLPKEP
jgi:Asp-tRNA(Asn)/Glu-tRNA(Gln) amidotransferase A subunit family amidase